MDQKDTDQTGEDKEMNNQTDQFAVARREPQAMEAARPLTEQDLISQVALIQRVMSAVMKRGEHYGIIPGCGDKPSLLKPGAEKLAITFRLTPTFDVKKSDLGNNHREYEVSCTLSNGGQGVGSCSTMEGKYRFRPGPKEDTGKPIPKEYWDKRNKALLGGDGYVAAKNAEGHWSIHRQGEKVEHDNPADYYNTVLKMAKKRAFVDAILTNTAASDCFTQDIEDMPEVIPGAQTAQNAPVSDPAPRPVKRATPAPKAPPAWPVEADAPFPEDEDPSGFDSRAAKADSPEDDLPWGDKAETGKDEDWWRSVVVPFGKNKGIRLGELEKGSLKWYCLSWEPRPKDDGSYWPNDIEFRRATDAAQNHYKFTP